MLVIPDKTKTEQESRLATQVLYREPEERGLGVRFGC